MDGGKKDVFYWKNGRLILKSAWSETGERIISDGSGEFLSRHDSTTVAVKENYRDGLRDSLWLYWSPTGNLLCRRVHERKIRTVS